MLRGNEKGRLRLCLLCGGQSSEHEVSLLSAGCVLEVIDQEKYEIILVRIEKDGSWVLVQDKPAGPAGVRVHIDIGPDPCIFTDDKKIDVDLIFPLLHGLKGEDGSVQGLFTLAGIPYIGAGILASALGLDKVLMKRIFESHYLPVCTYEVYSCGKLQRELQSVLSKIERHIGYPNFIKPANTGSSVGITKAHNRAELEAALDLAAVYDRKIIVEKALDARELECAVLGNDEPEASVVGEVVPGHEFYDYSAKYEDTGSRIIVPAEIPEELAEEVRSMAQAAFRSIDCAGMARVDFFLERETNRLYINEINTIPGFTPISMYPRLWEASGLDYPALIDELIQLCLERHERPAINPVN
jgi:D-alanine-D-alanine ligase